MFSFSKAVVLALAAAGSNSVWAAPAATAVVGPELAKRGPETIHFAECVTTSTINYYADDDDSNPGHPGNANVCVPSGGFHEGGSFSCRFATSVTLSWRLDAGAHSSTTNTVVGGADNGFHKFTCWRGDERVLYTDNNGHQCRSVYYCRPYDVDKLFKPVDTQEWLDLLDLMRSSWITR
ncbi:hypothetical protein F5Y19DRAFT_472575 [Xylariaceae sp. FL1651]|nr:hypothetical protein F5Y19DRAFT_472575 [Xylariaceae sp. FL1651]